MGARGLARADDRQQGYRQHALRVSLGLPDSRILAALLRATT
jgi:hypothetical protein